MSEVGCEGAEGAVGESQGDKWRGEVVRETEALGEGHTECWSCVGQDRLLQLGSACKQTCQGSVLNVRSQDD